MVDFVFLIVDLFGFVVFYVLFGECIDWVWVYLVEVCGLFGFDFIC